MQVVFPIQRYLLLQNLDPTLTLVPTKSLVKTITIRIPIIWHSLFSSLLKYEEVLVISVLVAFLSFCTSSFRSSNKNNPISCTLRTIKQVAIARPFQYVNRLDTPWIHYLVFLMNSLLSVFENFLEHYQFHY